MSNPQRTCVGCRERTSAADLLRVVVVEGVAVPDPRRRLPGRGASVHPDVECLTLALRRRAFVRALRTTGPLDTTGLEEFVLRQGEGNPAG
ncbi:MAG TPA: YlxR family protein [Sporichthyaceae bacterium]|nr:YlxR family protein [Sporichthyaceae bacterium]